MRFDRWSLPDILRFQLIAQSVATTVTLVALAVEFAHACTPSPLWTQMSYLSPAPAFAMAAEVPVSWAQLSRHWSTVRHPEDYPTAGEVLLAVSAGVTHLVVNALLAYTLFGVMNPTCTELLAAGGHVFITAPLLAVLAWVSALFHWWWARTR